jgi:hypothetical protein
MAQRKAAAHTRRQAQASAQRQPRQPLGKSKCARYATATANADFLICSINAAAKGQEKWSAIYAEAKALLAMAKTRKYVRNAKAAK